MFLLKYIWMCLTWVVHHRCTLNERLRYDLAQKKGMYCEGVRQGLNSINAKYNPNLPPQEREYLNWQEHKEIYHPRTGTKYLSEEEYEDKLLEAAETPPTTEDILADPKVRVEIRNRPEYIGVAS